MTAALLLLAATLEHGSWNERIHATHDLAEYGADALPVLRVAADDADWQVRMTAVHLMGRIGDAAVPDLARELDGEPCRTVRITALHWLGSIGTPAASDALRHGLQDESGMVRLVGRYWLEKGGAPSTSVDPDAATAEQEDLTTCATSPAPGRLERKVAPKPAAADDGAERHEAVVTPDPPVKRATETLAGVPPLPERPASERGSAAYSPTDRARLDELDTLLAPAAPGTPETMPKAPAGIAERPASVTAGADFEKGDARRARHATVAPVPPGQQAETMPAAPASLPERAAPETSGADIIVDTSAAKSAYDALPSLRKLLVDADPAKRARAADELGKRGAAATPAVGALAAALRDPDRRVRASAALALGNIGKPADAAVPALVAALKHGPEEVAWSAAVALGRIGTPRADKAFARYARQSAGDLVRGAKP